MGAMVPMARRIITPVREAPVGLVHDRAIEVPVGVAVTAVTGSRVSVNQPETSAISSIVPGDPLYRATLPPAPTGAMTRFGTVWPATKFRFDVPGRAIRSPCAVRNPGFFGAVTVTFSTAAETSESGTPPLPPT